MEQQRYGYWQECAQLATELRRQMGAFTESDATVELTIRDCRQWTDNLRVLELALWTASAECVYRRTAMGLAE